MATEILKKQTIVGTDAQYEANRNSYGEGTVFESTSLLGENDIDPAYTSKFVERKVSTTGLYAYCFDTTGITKTRYISEGFPAYSLVERDEKGRVRTADPEGQNDAVNKKYVDDNFVPKTSRIGIVYCTDNKGNQARINYSENNAAWTIAQRDGSGHVRTADPEGQNDAVNKSYADTRFRYTHFIQVEFVPVPDYIACKGTIIYVSNSSTPITNINELPLNVTLYMNGLYADYPGVVYNAKRISESGVEVGLMQDSNGISSNETVTMTFTIITDTVL